MKSRALSLFSTGSVGGGGARLRNLRKMKRHTDEYKEYLRSTEWLIKRKQVFKQKGRVCERCTSKKKIHVHHATYEHLFNELLEELFVFCEACHNEYHTRIGVNKTTIDLTIWFISTAFKKETKVKKKIKERVHLNKMQKLLLKNKLPKAVRRAIYETRMQMKHGYLG